MRKVAVLVLISACYTESKPVARPVAVATQSEAPGPHAKTAADPLGFLPATAEIVVSVDVGVLRGTPLWTRVEPFLVEKIKPVIEKYRAACGFDPTSQIDHFVVAMTDADKTDGVIVIGGLGRAQMMGCITRASRSAPQLAHLERNVLVLHRQPGETPIALAFADPRTLVVVTGPRATSADSVRAVLDAGTPLRGNERFMEHFAETAHHAWFYVDGTSKSLASALAAFNVHPRAIFGVLDAPAGITAKVVTRVQTAAEATTLVTKLQPQLGSLKSLVEKLEIRADDVDAVIDIVMTEQQLSLGGLLGP